jgi:hypothetical protein
MKKRPQNMRTWFALALATAMAAIGCGDWRGTRESPSPQATVRTAAIPTAARTKVLVEIDQMQQTPRLEESLVVGGATVSLAGIYEPGGLDMEVRHDQGDLPFAPAVRVADLHALLTAFRSLQPAGDGPHVHVLVVSADVDDPKTLGIMFDFGADDANGIPREGVAVFATPHQNLPGGEAPELLLTTAHEMAHVFNLHHSDWEGSSFSNGGTIESYSPAGTVKWALSAQSRTHLLTHPSQDVRPGRDSLPFATVTPAHAAAHNPYPGESFVVVDEANLATARRAPGGARAMAVRSARAGRRVFGGTDHPLRLDLQAPKTQYIIGEPLTVTVGLHNRGADTREVLDLLDPSYSFLNVEIRRPGSTAFEPFRPAIRAYRRGQPPLRLEPNGSLHSVVKLFFGAEGWTFDRPGSYVVRADYPADMLATDQRLQSEELTLDVVEPPSDATRRASQLMLGTEQGLFLLFNGGDHLRRGRESLMKVSEEAGATPFAPAARLALGLAALQPTIVSTGAPSRPPVRLDEAKRYLEGTLEAELPALSRLKAQETLANALVKENKAEEARAVRDRTIRALENEETATRKLDRFRRREMQ